MPGAVAVLRVCGIGRKQGLVRDYAGLHQEVVPKKQLSAVRVDLGLAEILSTFATPLNACSGQESPLQILWRGCSIGIHL